MSDVRRPSPGEGSGGDMAADVGGLSFEDALAELEQIVRGLEGGQQKLEDAISCLRAGRRAAPALRGEAGRGRGAGRGDRRAGRRHRWRCGRWNRRMPSDLAESLPADRGPPRRRAGGCAAVDRGGAGRAAAGCRTGAEARLAEAMRYAALGGGKRLRGVPGDGDGARCSRVVADLRGPGRRLGRDAARLFAGA